MEPLHQSLAAAPAPEPGTYKSAELHLQWTPDAVHVETADGSRQLVVDGMAPCTVFLGRGAFPVKGRQSWLSRLLGQKSATEQRLFVELRTRTARFRMCAAPPHPRQLISLPIVPPQGDAVPFEPVWAMVVTAHLLGARVELEVPEIRGELPPPPQQLAAPAPELPKTTSTDPAQAVFVYLERAPQAAEALERAYAESSGLSLYEARMRFKQLSGMPAVMGRFESKAQAAPLVEHLRAIGLDPSLFHGSGVETDEARVLVKAMSVIDGDSVLEVVSPDSGRHSLVLGDVTQLISGSRPGRSRTLEESTTVRKVDLGQGRRISVESKSLDRKIVENDQRFFLLLVRGHETPYMFYEESLNHRGMPTQDLTRRGSFDRLIAWLLETCPEVAFDDRLCASRSTRAHMLSRQLDLVQHFDLLMTLVLRSA